MTSPVVDRQNDLRHQDDVIVLSTGYTARIIPVGASLVDEVVAYIAAPKVPMFFNEDKGREEENPTDPAYVEAVAKAERERAIAVIDTLIMFGLELEEPPPADGAWLKKLCFLEKRGQLDLSGYDLDDEFDREFLFKKYIATGTADLMDIGRKAGLTQEAISQAAQNFPGNP